MDYARGYAAGYADALVQGKKQAQVFDEAFVLDLIKLVHPDKHPPGRYAEANRLTAKLIAMRRIK